MEDFVGFLIGTNLLIIILLILSILFNIRTNLKLHKMHKILNKIKKEVTYVTLEEEKDVQINKEISDEDLDRLFYGDEE